VGLPRTELRHASGGSDVRIRGYAPRLSRGFRRGRACLRQRAGRRFRAYARGERYKSRRGPFAGERRRSDDGWVARALPGALAQALADVGRAGAPISVRIDYVILGPSSGGVQFGAAAPDQMIGEVIVGGIAHELRASTSYYPSAVDQPHFEQSNYDRVFQLSRAFAYWAARGYSGT
jgi:hypothetical protein